MKDLVVKGKWIKREIIILALMFVIAFVMNIIGIAKHNTRWIELLSQMHIVIILTFVLYFILGLLRLLVRAVILPFKKSKTDNL